MPRRLGRFLLFATTGFLILSLLLVALYRLVPPPVTRVSASRLALILAVSSASTTSAPWSAVTVESTTVAIDLDSTVLVAIVKLTAADVPPTSALPPAALTVLSSVAEIVARRLSRPQDSLAWSRQAAASQRLGA